MAAETDAQRTKREQRRVLFDGVAGLYDATRQGYPGEIVDAIRTAAGVGPGSAVLEIGCGTGQLTRQLAGRGFSLTAIDIGPAMAEAARRNVTDPMARFEVSAFEDYPGGGPFDLIVSATAFHWVDPEVGLPKTARLLRPGGWLALLSTGERYPEPLETALRELWMRYSRQTSVWIPQHPAWLAALRESPLFGTVTEAGQQTPLRLPADAVVGVERTRATFLSYDERDQAGFTAELRSLLGSSSHIDLAQETFLAMAQVAG